MVFIKDNSIVLNLSPTAVRDLNLGDEFISFSARFAGVSRELFVPLNSVRAVYAKENGEGIVLPPPEDSAQPVVSSDPTQSPGLSAVTQDSQESQASVDHGDGDDDSPPKPGKKPHLTIVE